MLSRAVSWYGMSAVCTLEIRSSNLLSSDFEASQKGNFVPFVPGEQASGPDQPPMGPSGGAGGLGGGTGGSGPLVTPEMTPS